MNPNIIKELVESLEDIKKYSTFDSYFSSFNLDGLNRVKRRFVSTFAKRTYNLALNNKLLVNYNDYFENAEFILPYIDCVNKFQDKIVCITFKDNFISDYEMGKVIL